LNLLLIKYCKEIIDNFQNNNILCICEKAYKYEKVCKKVNFFAFFKFNLLIIIKKISKIKITSSEFEGGILKINFLLGLSTFLFELFPFKIF
jgi:hypothetical protein